MGEVSHREGSVVGSSGEGSCWATCDWHQTESHPTNQSPGRYWWPRQIQMKKNTSGFVNKCTFCFCRMSHQTKHTHIHFILKEKAIAMMFSPPFIPKCS